MKPPLEKHLNDLAGRMGRFLRGFEDPRVHLGSSERFAAQFRTVLDWPAFHAPGAHQLVSFSEAARTYRLSRLDTAGDQPVTPVSLMIRGLHEAAPFSDGNAGELVPGNVRDDVAKLLRVPALTFYLQFSDCELFFATLGDVAARNGFRLAKRSGSQMICPTCGRALSRESKGPAVRCSSCNQSTEAIMPLPMVPGAVASVSYEMLRQIVSINFVETYQEESEIRPLIFADGVQ